MRCRRRRSHAVHAEDAAMDGDGRRFAKHFVTDPSCCPSRAAMMTGRCPTTTASGCSPRGPSSTTPLHGVLSAQRGLLDVRRRQVPHHLAEDHDAAVLRPLHRDLGRLQQRGQHGWTGSAHADRVLHHRLGVRGREYVTSALGLRQAVPAVRDAAGPALGEGHEPGRHVTRSGRSRRPSMPTRRWHLLRVGGDRPQRTSPRTCAT